MTTAAFVISLLALIASAVSITWQVLSWSLSGARLTVAAGFAITDFDHEDYLMVTVTNRGRQETSVSMIGFLTNDGRMLVERAPAFPTVTLPAKISPGASISYPFLRQRMITTIASENLAPVIRPFADSGHGRKIGKSVTMNP